MSTDLSDAISQQGHYAGAATRLAAFAIDQGGGDRDLRRRIGGPHLGHHTGHRGRGALGAGDVDHRRDLRRVAVPLLRLPVVGQREDARDGARRHPRGARMGPRRAPATPWCERSRCRSASSPSGSGSCRSSWAGNGVRCTTSSRALRWSTPGTRGRRVCGSSPASTSARHRVRSESPGAPDPAFRWAGWCTGAMLWRSVSRSGDRGAALRGGSRKVGTPQGRVLARARSERSDGSGQQRRDRRWPGSPRGERHR